MSDGNNECNGNSGIVGNNDSDCNDTEISKNQVTSIFLQQTNPYQFSVFDDDIGKVVKHIYKSHKPKAEVDSLFSFECQTKYSLDL